MKDKNIIMVAPIRPIYRLNGADDRFDNLLNVLYLSDETEIDAKISEIYSDICNSVRNTINKTKKELFELNIQKYVYNVNSICYKLMNYDIHTDLEYISDNDKKSFFRKLLDIKNINNEKKKSNLPNFLIILKYFMFSRNNKEYDTDLKFIMKKTNNYINSQGKKLKRKIIKLYDIV